MVPTVHFEFELGTLSFVCTNLRSWSGSSSLVRLHKEPQRVFSRQLVSCTDHDIMELLYYYSYELINGHSPNHIPGSMPEPILQKKLDIYATD